MVHAPPRTTLGDANANVGGTNPKFSIYSRIQVFEPHLSEGRKDLRPYRVVYLPENSCKIRLAPYPCGRGSIQKTLSYETRKGRGLALSVPLRGSKLRVASLRVAMPQALRCAIVNSIIQN
ncbi:hypothetical protein [Nostoc sp.]|uniref:hypothetical protein n=1 Tax=Nostoc sp. TaxID=1180 RepID=UPI002FFCE02E